MGEIFKYQSGGGARALGELLDRIDAGDMPVCFRCGAELIVALEPDQIAKHKVHPGIYCPNRHIAQLIEIRPPNREEFWKQFKKSQD